MALQTIFRLDPAIIIDNIVLRFLWFIPQLKIVIAEPVGEGKATRWKISAEVRQKIIEWRQQQLSPVKSLSSWSTKKLKFPTFERVLVELGFTKPPRRTQLKIGRTIKDAKVPERAKSISLAHFEGKRMESDGAGV